MEQFMKVRLVLMAGILCLLVKTGGRLIKHAR
jgi:hypothetical protein